MAERFWHYTDEEGYKAIASRPIWTFEAAQPPGNHPFGAYFTTLGPQAPNLAQRLRIPRRKLAYAFCFTADPADFQPIRGGRGTFIVLSSSDYTVEKDRQVFAGPRDEAQEVGNAQ